MSARDDLIDEYGRAETAPLGTLTDLRVKLATIRAEVLREAADAINTLPQDYECDPGRGDAAKLLRLMADAGNDTPSARAWHAEFFRPDRTYVRNLPDRAPEDRPGFWCVAVAEHPTKGEPRAFGFERDGAGHPWMTGPAMRPKEWANGWTLTDVPTRHDAETCTRCHLPFDPADTRFDGRARYRDTPFCGGCIDRCHESTDPFHQCPVCRPAEAAPTARYERDRCMHGTSFNVECGGCDALGQIGGPA